MRINKIGLCLAWVLSLSLAVFGYDGKWTDTERGVTFGFDASGTEACVSVIALRGDSAEVVIPSQIADDANIYKVTSIGQTAWDCCKRIASVDIPSSVTSIADRAFCECYNLTSVTIPNSVTSIGDYAFRGCSLSSVTIPDSVTSIGESAFSSCTFTSVTIPNSVTSIGDYVFYSCTALTSVTIPDSVTSIGYEAFGGCRRLTSVTIPNSVTSIGDNAFYGCDGLESVTIPNSVTSIGDKAFYYCSGLTSVAIPKSVESIGDGAFSSCSGLTSVTIPECVFGKLSDTFSGSVWVRQVAIADGVESIGDDAFKNCSGLTSVVIPSSVKSISESAFSGCSGLTSVTIPECVFGKLSTTFPDSTDLKQVEIAYGVESIKANAFEGCSGLTSVAIPNSVKSIGAQAFAGCTSLTSATIPACVFGKLAKTFPNSTNLREVEIADGVESIDAEAFYDCNKLTSVTIPSSVTSIGDYAFSYCTSLTSVTIPESVKSIGAQAFSYCSSLTSVTIPSSVTSIGNNAFYYCSSLTSVTIPNSVTSIGNSAFKGSALTTVVVDFGDTSRVKELLQDSGVNFGSLSFVELPPLTVGEVKVQKIEPFGLAIDYTVGNIIAGADGYVPEVTLTLADDTTYTAATLSGDTRATAGSHRLYWNLAADGIKSFSGATVSVTYKGEDITPDDVTITPVTPATLAGVSATVLTKGSKISAAVTINCAPFEDATVSVKVNDVEVDTSSGTYNWLPNKVGENKIVYTINDIDFIVTYDAVERPPEITDVQVQKVAPFGLAIDYTSTMMENATTDYSPVITAMKADGSKVYTAKTVTDPISQSADGNTYRVYWNMAKDGIEALDGATISVWLRESTASEEFEYCIVDLSSGANGLNYDVEYIDATTANFNSDEYKTTKLVMKRVPAGEFIMGEDQTSEDALANHKVTISHCFYMALFETTQKQWELVTGSNPSGWNTDGAMRPVGRVSYYMIRGTTIGAKWPASIATDSDSFLGKLRAKTGGLAFDLPSEAQWEYVCRAGTTTKWSFGDDESVANSYMWHNGNSSWGYSSRQTHVVGSLAQNPWGFYDMHGNAFEWCLDRRGDLNYGTDPGSIYVNSDRMVVRGGCCLYEATRGASYNRSDEFALRDAYYDNGFRLVMAPQKVSNVYEVNDVSTSVIVDGATVTDTLTVEYRPAEGRPVCLWVDCESVVDWTATAGRYPYRPTENGVHTIEHLVSGAEMSVTYNFNLPPLTVSGVKVQKIEPFGLAIDYTVGNVMAGADGYVPEVTLTVGGTKHTAATLSGDTSTTEGAHRLYWNLAADGIASFEGATISVTYKDKVLIDEPTTVEGDGALYCVVDLSNGSDADKYPLEFLDEEPEGGFKAYDEYKTTKLVLKRIDAGSFIMGEDQTSESAKENNKVTLTKPFYMALFQTTQRQWELVTGSNPCSSTGYGKGNAYPVHYVSYNNIRGSSSVAKWPASNAVDDSSFLGKLRARTGLNFDLPTEAQWEYACRAGTTKTYSYGDSADGVYMWYNGNASSTMHEVGTKSPNPWDFYDMHGNVWEWCLDWYGDLDYGTDPKGPSEGSSEDPSRVIRGGSWVDDAASCSSSFRNWNSPSYGYCDVGFRLSRTMPATPVTPATSSPVSATVLADGSKVSEAVTINCAPIEGASVTVKVNGTPVSPTGGSYAWLPSKVGANTIVYTITDANNFTATFTVTYDAEERAPEITAVEVKKVAPFGLAIDYTYTMMEDAETVYSPVITAKTGETVYTAKTLSAAQSLGNGKYRVYWNMAKDGVPSLDGATVSVTLKEGGELSKYCIIDLSKGSSATEYGITWTDEVPADGFNTDTYKTNSLVLKRIDAGSFIMGEEQGNIDHTVILTQPFYMALFETTQAQWELVTGRNLSQFSIDGEKRPVEWVSYSDIRGSSDGANWPTDNKVDADSFLGRLRARTELSFDLPTEAQWEYACRAGTTTAYNLGGDTEEYLANAGWYGANSEDTTHDVGGKTANAWGLYDMHGNVAEWCLDFYGDLSYGKDPRGASTSVVSYGSYRVLRGGAFNAYSAGWCSLCHREFDGSNERYFAFGFRLALPVEQKSSNVYEVNNVTTSVIKDGDTVNKAIDFNYLGEAAPVSILAGTDLESADFVVKNATLGGSKSWQPSKPGKYECVYIVGGTEVLSATYDMENIPIVFSKETLDSFNYEGVYDGAAHSISLVKGCTALAEITGAKVTYKETEEGDYKADNPLYTDVCTNTVWYQITADGYKTYTGKATVTINPLDISGGEESDWECRLGGYFIYNGQERRQTVTYAKFKGLDVTYDLTDNIGKNAANYTLTLTGNGNFKGSREITWSIAPRELDLTAANGEKVYDGTPLTVTNVTARGFVDGEGATYDISSYQTSFGESENIIGADDIIWNEGTLASNYAVTRNAGTLKVTKRPVTIKSESADLVYNGNAQSYEVITIGGDGFVAGEGIVTSNWAKVSTVRQGEVTNEFDYVFNDNTDADNYEVTVEYGTIKIVPKTLTTEMFSLKDVPAGGYVWDGNPKRPDYSSQDGSPNILGNDDFSVDYTDNTNVGEATVTFTGKNNYTGTVELHFTIGELTADVTFDALGGKIGSASVVTQEQIRVYNNLPATPTRENYNFVGWYGDVADDDTKATAGEEWVAKGDHTLYAKWEVEPTEEASSVTYSCEQADDGPDTIRITGWEGSLQNVENLIIPDTINGKYVTEIADDAFKSAPGITSVTLPMFLKKIGFRAFYNIKTLTTLNIPAVRDWENPSLPGSLTIGKYAFSSAALTELYLPEEVTEICSYAFLNCQKLATLTIEGDPELGSRPFQRTKCEGQLTVQLNPALASNTSYMSTLSEQANVAAVRTDAIVESVAPMSVSVDADGNVEIPLSVGRAANWGNVDASKVRVEYSENLTDTPTTLVPEVKSNDGDTLSISVTPPKKASSGFFRVKVVK